ncbi:MAG: hypothetical protein ABIQ64_02720 [Candidatus Saccharimonadales bacterium]
MADQRVSKDLQDDITMLAPPERRRALRASFHDGDHATVFGFLNGSVTATRERWTTEEIISKYQDGTLMDFGRDLERSQKALELHRRLSAELR